MSDLKQSHVASTVWSWKEGPESQKPPKSPIRKRAAIRGCVMIAVALVLLFIFDKVILARVEFSLAGFVLVSGLFIHSLFLGFERLIMKFATGVGIVLTWLLLVLSVI